MLKNILFVLFLLISFVLGYFFHHKFIIEKLYGNINLHEIGKKEKEKDIFFKLKSMPIRKCSTDNKNLLVKYEENILYYEKINDKNYVCEK